MLAVSSDVLCVGKKETNIICSQGEILFLLTKIFLLTEIVFVHETHVGRR